MSRNGASKAQNMAIGDDSLNRCLTIGLKAKTISEIPTAAR